MLSVFHLNFAVSDFLAICNLRTGAQINRNTLGQAVVTGRRNSLFQIVDLFVQTGDTNSLTLNRENIVNRFFLCGSHAVSAILIILYKLDLGAVCIVQLELSAAQQLARSAAVLDQVELAQISLGFTVRALGLMIVAVNQMCFVLILVRIDLSLLVHNGAVGNYNVSACGQSSNVAVLKLDVEGLIINVFSNQCIVVFCYISIVNGNLDRTRDKRQTLAHGIVQDVAVVCSLHGNGDLIVDSIADLSGVACSPVVGRSLYRFINGGRFILLADGNIGCGGIQTAENTQRSIYQIVAEFKTGKANSFGGSGCGFRSGNAFFGCIIKCSLGKLLIIFSGSAAYPSGVAVLKRNVAATGSTGLKEIFPVGHYSVGVGVSISIKAGQVEHLINLVGLIFSCVANGDAAGVVLIVAFVSKRRDSHGANHSNCQQRSHEFLHCFFHGKAPFFSAPCRPLRFAQGGKGVSFCSVYRVNFALGGRGLSLGRPAGGSAV